MKKIRFLILLNLLIYQFGYSQGVKFDRTEIILSNIKEYNLHKLIYKFTVEGKDSIEVRVIPKTYLTNVILDKVKYGPGEEGILTLEFYPKKTGTFHEEVTFKIDGKTVTQLTYSGYITGFSEEYKMLIQNNQLSSDKDIVFMIVDATTYEYIPNAKISIYNVKNNKTYIGKTDQNGILKDKLPDGQYSITSLVEGYEADIVGTQIEPRRNAALILIKKIESKPLEIYTSKLKNNIIATIQSDKKEYITEPIIIPVDTPPVKIIIPEPIIEPVKIAQETPKPISKPIELIPELPKPKIDTIKKEKEIVEEEIDTVKNFNIVMLLDISLSMNKNDRIGILKKSIQYMVRNFKQYDKMGIITFNDTTNVIYPLSYIQDKDYLLNLIDSIKTSGKTNGVESISVAIDELNKNTDSNAINMIILSTDGKITTDPNDFKLIYDKIYSLRKNGNYFSSISFGASSYDDRLMLRLAQVGGGIYHNYKSDETTRENLLMDKIYENITRKKTSQKQ